MKRKVGLLLMGVGLMLLMGSFGLFLHNQHQSRQASAVSHQALEQILPVIEERADAIANGDIKEPVVDNKVSYDALISESSLVSEDPRELVAVTAGENDYIGALYIPDLGLELPVLAELNDSNLEMAPCYYSGSMISEDLVIGAHNYMTHFARIWRLKPGAEVIFTNMNGVTWIFEVSAVETLAPTAGAYLLSGEYPLTLFTCTYVGNDRTAVRCVLKA